MPYGTDTSGDKQMPRPLKIPQERLSNIINIRVTAKQKSKLEGIARASGLTMYEVMRRKIDGLKIPNKERLIVIDEIRLLRQELAKQGGLIKHLYSLTGINPDECAAAILVQKKTIEMARELINKLEKRVNKYDNSES